MSTLKDILKSVKIKPHKVELTDYPGVDVYVRGMTLSEARDYGKLTERDDGTDADYTHFLLSRCVVDEHGEQALDAEAIEHLSAGAIVELTKKISELNGGRYDQLKKS